MKAAEIATDAVGTEEIQGVTKLIFADCNIRDTFSYATNQGNARHCSVQGIDYDDRAIVTNNGNLCFVMEAIPTDSTVYIRYTNVCSSSSNFGTNSVGVIVFDT